METLQITKEAAVKAHDDAKSSGRKLLENLFGKKTFQKDITERIEDFDDVLEELGIDQSVFINACIGLTRDEIAYKKVKLIAQALNEGWVPDWTNGEWDKYYPWFEMGSPSGSGFSYDGYDTWRSGSSCSSRLCYKSAKLARFAGETFTDIYKDLFTL